jgi:hypothetical protein
LHAYPGELPLTLSFQRDGDLHARLGDQLWTLVNEIEFQDDHLGGQMIGDIGTEDANRRPYRLHLDLKRRGQILNGAIIAISHLQEGVASGGAPGRRAGNALSHWAELKKQEKTGGNG